MERYTAGYTDFFGVSNDIGSANTLSDLYRDITGEDSTEATRSDIIQAVKKKEPASESAWVREAPLRLEAFLEDYDSGKDRYCIFECFSSLAEAVEYIIVRYAEGADADFDCNSPGARSVPYTVDGQECDYFQDFESVTIPEPRDLTLNGVRDLLLRTLEPLERFKAGQNGYDLSCMDLVPSPAFQVTMLAEAAAKIDEDLKDAVRKAHRTGIPQASLARLAGVSQPTIGRWVKDN